MCTHMKLSPVRLPKLFGIVPLREFCTRRLHARTTKERVHLDDISCE